MNKLKVGDTVGVIAPSDSFAKSGLLEGVKEIESWGLKVILGKNIFEDIDDYMAGSVKQRAEDLMRMIDERKIKCIWCAEGGYAITPLRRFLTDDLAEKIKKGEKMMIGYSDITMLTNFWTNLNCQTIYGPTLSGLSRWSLRSQEWMKSLLMEKKNREMEIEIFNGKNDVRGKIIPGGIECMQLGFGTSCDVLSNNNGPIILVLEDWNGEKTTTLRQLDSIVDHKDFKKVAGVLLGRFPLMTSESYEQWSKKVDMTTEIVRRLIEIRPEIFIGRLMDFGHPSTYYQDNPEEFLAVPSGVEGEVKPEGSVGKLFFEF